MLLRLGRGIVVAVWLVVCAGCGNSGQQLAQQTSNIKPLAVLYGRYVSTHQGQPPPNEEAFRTFIQEESVILQQLGVSDPNALFVSSRDNKPFVIKYGQASGPPGPGGVPVIIYEQEGANGTRYVASSLGAVEEVDEAKFREYVPAAG